MTRASTRDSVGGQAVRRRHVGDAAALVDDVREIARALRRREGASTTLGLGGRRLAVLRAVAEAPGASPTALAARLHFDPSSASVQLRGLVADGYLAVAVDPADRRCRHVTLTARGRRVADRAGDTADTALWRAVAALPAAQRGALAQALAALRARLA